MFASLHRRQFSLRFDRPEKIIGCRKAGSEPHYAVMFKCGPPELVGFGVFAQSEVTKWAPWLLGRFFLEMLDKSE